MNILFVTSRPLEASLSSSIRKITTIKSLLLSGANITLLTTTTPSSDLAYKDIVDLLNIKKIEIETGIIYAKCITKKESKISNIKLTLRKCYYKFRVYDPLKSCINHVNLLEGKIDKHFDMVLSVSDPKSSHLLAIELLKRKIISCDKYIQIWGDPMYTDITNKSLIPKVIIKKEEAKLLSWADRVFYVSPLTLVEQKEIFKELSDKMDILYPGYLEETIYDKVEYIKKVGYFGDYNSNIRDLQPLYEAISDSRYELTVCGNSNLYLNQSKNHKIYPRQCYEKVKQLESESDLLVFLANKSGTQIPGKIYQYVGTNKPILLILDGNEEELKKIFVKYNRFYFCKNNPTSIRKTLDNIDLSDSDVKNIVLEEFNLESIGKKIMNSAYDKV